MCVCTQSQAGAAFRGSLEALADWLFTRTKLSQNFRKCFFGNPDHVVSEIRGQRAGSNVTGYEQIYTQNWSHEASTKAARMSTKEHESKVYISKIFLKSRRETNS